MSASVYAAVPLMMGLAILQSAVLARLPLPGLVPQLAFLVALSWGLLRDIEEGVVWAFVAGLLVDLFSVTPLGVTSLAWMVAILVALWLVRLFPTSRFILPVVAAALGTLVYLPLQLLALWLLGHGTSLAVIATLLPLAVGHAIAVLPVYWMMVVLQRRLRPRRVEI